MKFIKDFFRKLDVEVLRWAYPVRHLAQVLQVSSRDLHLAGELLHLAKSMDLFVYHFHNVIGYFLAFEIFKELFYLILFIVLLRWEMFL